MDKIHPVRSHFQTRLGEAANRVFLEWLQTASGKGISIPRTAANPRFVRGKLRIKKILFEINAL